MPLPLMSGSTDPLVRRLQTSLKTLGYYSGNIDASFGSNTQTAVKTFQQKLGLQDTGIVDATTLSLALALTAAVDEAVAARTEAVKAKDEAVAARTEAVKAKDEAVAARTETVKAKDEAVAARTEAVAEKDEAVAAKTEAVTAKTKAETAKTAAEAILAYNEARDLVDEIGQSAKKAKEASDSAQMSLSSTFAKNAEEASGKAQELYKQAETSLKKAEILRNFTKEQAAKAQEKAASANVAAAESARDHAQKALDEIRALIREPAAATPTSAGSNPSITLEDIIKLLPKEDKDYFSKNSSSSKSLTKLKVEVDKHQNDAESGSVAVKGEVALSDLLEAAANEEAALSNSEVNNEVLMRVFGLDQDDDKKPKPDDPQDPELTTDDEQTDASMSLFGLK